MKTILLVDDSSTILMTVATVLGKAGYSVTQATGGPQALTHLRTAAQADLMITDLNMPVMDGIALIRETRKLPARARLPILVLTTESQQSFRDQAKAAGAMGWLVKPVVAADLIKVLGKVLAA